MGLNLHIIVPEGPMKTIAVLVFAHTSLVAQNAQSRLVKEVRHELVMLPYYNVFDNLTYSIEGGAVTLAGQVTNPS